MASLMPNGKQQYFNSSGAPLAGGRVYTYAAGGTVTNKATYTTAAASVQNTNPIILDARGEATIFWSGSYNVVVKDASDVLIYSTDNYTPPGDALTALLASSTGASMIGYDTLLLDSILKNSIGKVVTSITSLKAIDKTKYTQAFVTGYYAAGDGGGGAYWYDSSDTTSTDNGGTIIVATDGGRWKLVVASFVTVKQFGAKGDASTDDTTALQAARDYISTAKKLLVFPQGTYCYSVSPNWAIQGAHVEADGEVKLRYTGVGNAVIFDADAADAVDPVSGLVYNVHFGDGNRFIVECPSTALNGVFVRSIHHSKLGFNIRGAGSSSAGLKVNFAVCTNFDIVCSVNEAGWYLTAKPAIGIDLDKRGANEPTSYCYFPNAAVEGPTIGIQLTATLGNIFTGGTSEACSTYGLFASSGAKGDRVNGMDFEANTTADVYNLGTGIEINSCDSDNIINFGSIAVRGTVRGGQHKSILLDSGSTGCAAVDTIYNRSNNGGTFSDGGTSSVVCNVRDGGSNTLYLTGSKTYDPPNMATGTALQTTVTVTGAKMGDSATCAFSNSIGATSMSAAVTAADTVTVTWVNLSGVGVDNASGTLTATVKRGN